MSVQRSAERLGGRPRSRPASVTGTLVDALADRRRWSSSASLAFGGAYGGTRWLVAAAGGALVGAAVGRTGRSAALALVGSRRSRPSSVIWRSGRPWRCPSTAIGGVVPSVESLRLLTVGVVSSWRQLLTVAVPVGTSGAVMIPVYLTALVTAAAGTGIAVRTRTARRSLWALAAPLSMLIVAALFGAEFAVAAAGLRPRAGRRRPGLGVLADPRRRRRDSTCGARCPPLVVLAAALVAGFVPGPAGRRRRAVRAAGDRPAAVRPAAVPQPAGRVPQVLQGTAGRRPVHRHRAAGRRPDPARRAGRLQRGHLRHLRRASTRSARSATRSPTTRLPVRARPPFDVTIDDYRGVFLPDRRAA